MASAESGRAWPLAARAIAAFRSPADKGIGDTLARNLARFGGDAFKRIYRKLTGKDCGCADRQAALNRLFPYGATPRPFDYVAIDHGRLTPGHNFNCSIIAHQGKRLFAYRQSWANARIRFAELGADWQPTRCLPPTWLDPRGYRGHEDPRLFHFRDQLHCSYTAYDGRKTDVGYLSFKPDMRPDVGHVLNIDGRRPWEKNWVFFQHEDALYAIYTPTPHVVLRVVAGRVQRAYESAWRPAWRWGDIRGGASPVRIDDEYYHFFHARSDPDGGTYSVGLYTFEAKPPFRPARMISRPLLLGRAEDRTDPATATVIYPGGAVLDGVHWRIACGYMDAGCRIYSFGAADLEAELRPVQSSARGIIGASCGPL